MLVLEGYQDKNESVVAFKELMMIEKDPYPELFTLGNHRYGKN